MLRSITRHKTFYLLQHIVQVTMLLYRMKYSAFKGLKCFSYCSEWFVTMFTKLLGLKIKLPDFTVLADLLLVLENKMIISQQQNDNVS